MNGAELKKLRAELKLAKYAGETNHVKLRDMLNDTADVSNQIDDPTDQPVWKLLSCADKTELTAVIPNPAKSQQLSLLLSMGRFSPLDLTLNASGVFTLA